MSLATATLHPSSEPSPPTSPNPAQGGVITQRKQVAAKRLPESPPASASPSPAHISTQQSSTSPTKTVSTSVTSTMSTSHLPAPEALTVPQRAGSQLSRTSSKHRLDDDESTNEEPNKRRRTDHDRNETQETLDAAEDGSDDHVPPNAPLYRLSDQPVPRSRPHPTQDLFGLYGLDSLADTVRRKDPVTGDKINKLRKSYESKIKEFSGKNRPVVNEGEFFYLLNYPDEEWDISHCSGKEISQALSTDGQHFSEEMKRKVEAAFINISNKPLKQAERDKWRSALDLESLAPKTKAPVVQATSRQPPHNATIQPTIEGIRRPKRRGTKRNYNDEAFEGYNEGYVDDDLDLSGDGDFDGRSSLSTGSRKRRRTDSVPASTFPSTTPQWAVSVGGNGR